MSPLSSFVSNAASLVSANPNVAYPKTPKPQNPKTPMPSMLNFNLWWWIKFLK